MTEQVMNIFVAGGAVVGALVALLGLALKLRSEGVKRFVLIPISVGAAVVGLFSLARMEPSSVTAGSKPLINHSHLQAKPRAALQKRANKPKKKLKISTSTQIKRCKVVNKNITTEDRNFWKKLWWNIMKAARKSNSRHSVNEVFEASLKFWCYDRLRFEKSFRRSAEYIVTAWVSKAPVCNCRTN